MTQKERIFNGALALCSLIIAFYLLIIIFSGCATTRSIERIGIDTVTVITPASHDVVKVTHDSVFSKTPDIKTNLSEIDGKKDSTKSDVSKNKPRKVIRGETKRTTVIYFPDTDSMSIENKPDTTKVVRPDTTDIVTPIQGTDYGSLIIIIIIGIIIISFLLRRMK